jgi:hypothetical protein
MINKQELSAVIATFTDARHAQHFVDELKRAGFTNDEVGVLATHSKVEEVEDEAVAGAITGGMVGAVAGVVATSLIPGVGPAIATGLLAGLLGGSAAGGLLGVLVGFGVPEDQARHHEEGFRSGQTLVVVQAVGRALEALAILRRCESDLGPQAPPTVTGKTTRSIFKRWWRGRTSAATYRSLGEDRLAHGDYPHAIADFTEAIHLDSQNATAYLERGLAYEAEGQYQEAISDYDLALRLDPNDADAYVHRGDAWFALDDFHQAIHDYTAAIRLEPNNGLAYYYRSLAHQETGEMDQAKSDHETALRLTPSLAKLSEHVGWKPGVRPEPEPSAAQR